MKHLNTPTSIVKQFCFLTPAAACIADIRLQHKGQRRLRSKSSGELVESVCQCFGAVLSPHTRQQQPEDPHRSVRVGIQRAPQRKHFASWLRRILLEGEWFSLYNGSDFDWGVGGTFGVRSRLAFAPPYIVVHGSTGFCLLSRRAKFWSWSWAPDLPVGQTRR